MKIAIVGSRSITEVEIEKHISECYEIVSGGAVGVDRLAAQYAQDNAIKLTVFLPEYERYARAAPIIRNKKIVEYCDKILVFWDNKSKGTKFVIEYARKISKPCEVIICT